MEKEINEVVWDIDSGVESVTIFFERYKGIHLVDEFDVPQEEKHSINYSAKSTDGSWVWVEIVNPQDIVEHEDATLPDITILANGNKYPLRDVIVQLVKEHEATDQDD